MPDETIVSGMSARAAASRTAPRRRARSDIERLRRDPARWSSSAAVRPTPGKCFAAASTPAAARAVRERAAGAADAGRTVAANVRPGRAPLDPGMPRSRTGARSTFIADAAQVRAGRDAVGA